MFPFKIAVFVLFLASSSAFSQSSNGSGNSNSSGNGNASGNVAGNTVNININIGCILLCSGAANWHPPMVSEAKKAATDPK